MSKLIFADIPMVFKSKMLYIIFGLSAFLGFSIVLISYPETETPEKLLALLYYNSSNFINMLMPILFGGVSIILISKEFSSGVIRNKVTMGHSRRNIILSWTVIYSLTTLITFILFFSALWITAAAFGINTSSLNAENLITEHLIILIYAIKFQLFSIFMVCIYSDVKTTVICYLLNNLFILPFMIFSMSDEYDFIIRAGSRINLYAWAANGSGLFLTESDKPWLTILYSTGLGALYLVFANLYFSKKDLK